MKRWTQFSIRSLIALMLFSLLILPVVKQPIERLFCSHENETADEIPNGYSVVSIEHNRSDKLGALMPGHWIEINELAIWNYNDPRVLTGLERVLVIGVDSGIPQADWQTVFVMVKDSQVERLKLLSAQRRLDVEVVDADQRSLREILNRYRR